MLFVQWENTSLGLHPCQNDPGTELVHVVLLEVLKLSGVAVDSPSLSCSFLRLITPVHLQVILVQFRALSREMSNKPISIWNTSNVILESEVSTLTPSKPIAARIGPAASRGRKTLIQRGQFTPGSSFSCSVVQQMLNLEQTEYYYKSIKKGR